MRSILVSYIESILSNNPCSTRCCQAYMYDVVPLAVARANLTDDMKCDVDYCGLSCPFEQDELTVIDLDLLAVGAQGNIAFNINEEFVLCQWTFQSSVNRLISFQINNVELDPLYWYWAAGKWSQPCMLNKAGLFFQQKDAEDFTQILESPIQRPLDNTAFARKYDNDTDIPAHAWESIQLCSMLDNDGVEEVERREFYTNQTVLTLLSGFGSFYPESSFDLTYTILT